MLQPPFWLQIGSSTGCQVLLNTTLSGRTTWRLSRVIRLEADSRQDFFMELISRFQHGRPESAS